jgi:hypothetical protein
MRDSFKLMVIHPMCHVILSVTCLVFSVCFAVLFAPIDHLFSVDIDETVERPSRLIMQMFYGRPWFGFLRVRLCRSWCLRLNVGGYEKSLHAGKMSRGWRHGFNLGARSSEKNDERAGDHLLHGYPSVLQLLF